MDTTPQPRWGVRKAFEYLTTPFASRAKASPGDQSTDRRATERQPSITSEEGEGGRHLALHNQQDDLASCQDFFLSWQAGITNTTDYNSSYKAEIDNIAGIANAMFAAEERVLQNQRQEAEAAAERAAAAAAAASTPAASQVADTTPNASPLEQAESAQLDLPAPDALEKTPSLPAPWATRTRQTPMRFQASKREPATSSNIPGSEGPKLFLRGTKRSAGSDFVGQERRVTRGSFLRPQGSAQTPAGRPASTPTPLLLARPSSGHAAKAALPSGAAAAEERPAFPGSAAKVQQPAFQTSSSMTPNTLSMPGFVNFDTPVAGLNAQRQVHFPHRPSSVVGQQDAQEAQPKRTFTTLRKPLGQPKGIVGKTLSIHQQILPTGFKPVNRNAPKSFQDFRKKRARDVEDQPGSTPHPAKKTRPVEESRLGRTTAAATSPPPTDTAQRILDTLSKMARPPASKRSLDEGPSLLPPPTASALDSFPQRPALPLQRVRRQTISFDDDPVPEVSKQEAKEEQQTEPMLIEAAKEPDMPAQSKPAPAQPDPKKLKREQPSSRFGLLQKSDSDESEEEDSGTGPNHAIKKAAAAKEADAVKPRPTRDGYRFGGNRAPEEGSRLQTFLKDASPSLSVPKPVFSFAAPAKDPADKQKLKAGAEPEGKLPNGFPDGAAAFGGGKKSSPAIFQLPSASEDKLKARPQKASFGDAGTMKAPSEPSPAKDDEKPAEETKPKPQASGWGDMFLKQNKAASQGSEAAAKAFLENPSMLARQSEPAEVSEPAKEGKPAEAAVQASGWGDMFLKKNKAASQTTDAATKSFLGDPSQPAASLAAGPGSEKEQPASSSQPEEGASGFSPMSIASASSPQQSSGAAANADPAIPEPIKFGFIPNASPAPLAFALPKAATNNDPPAASTSGFTFGSSVAPPAFGSTPAAEPTGSSMPSLSFANPGANSAATAGQAIGSGGVGFGSTVPGFSFGSAAPSTSESQSTAGFSFGNTAASISFGSSAPASGTSNPAAESSLFGKPAGSGAEAITGSAMSFGSPAPASQPSSLSVSGSMSQPSFLGNTAAGFSFGGSADTAKANGTAGATGFGSSMAASISGSGAAFSFGAQPTNAQTSNTTAGFTFPAAAASAPQPNSAAGFTFGSAAPASEPNQPNTGFSFGPAPASSAPSQAATGFSFGSAPSGIAFGSSAGPSSGSTAAGFTFGSPAPASAPSMSSQPLAGGTGFGQSAGATGFGQATGFTGFGQSAGSAGFGQSAPSGFGPPLPSGFGQPQASGQSIASASMPSPAPFGNSNTANSPAPFVFGATAPAFGSSPAPFPGFGGGGGMSLGASSTENPGALAQRKRLKAKRPARQ